MTSGTEFMGSFFNVPNMFSMLAARSHDVGPTVTQWDFFGVEN